MNPLFWKREQRVDYHYEEGKAWLKESRSGRRDTALAYAAFEFRLAIERILFQYWFELNNFNEEIINDARSFEKMRNAIFKSVGHQNKIKKYIEFNQLFLQSIKFEKKLIIPDFNRLDKHYDTCCDLCHILWTIRQKNRNLTRLFFEKFKEMERDLSDYTDGILSIPKVKVTDGNFNKIKEKFMNGEIGTSEVFDYINDIGLYSKLYDINGVRFIGTPVQPKK